MSSNLPLERKRRFSDELPIEAAGSGAVRSLTPHTEVNLREYFRILVKYRILVAACVVGSTLLALIYALTATPQYTAYSKIKISSYEPILAGAKIEDMLQQKSREKEYLDTQTEELRSFSLADRVLEDPDIRDSIKLRLARSWLASLFGEDYSEAANALVNRDSTYKNSVRLIREYLRSISVSAIRRTTLVNINATSESPRVAALMANRHADAYVEWVRVGRVEQQSRGLAYLRSQADELREKVADIERELADYAEANSIVAVNKDENITVQKMSQLNKMLTDATAKRIEQEKFYEEAKANLSNPSAGFDDSSTQMMRSDLARLESEYSQLGAKFTKSYPKMIQLKSQIDGLRQSIEQQRRQIVDGLRAKALAAKEEEKNFQEELDKQKSLTYELSKRQVQYNVLNRELTSSRELLANVVRQIKETSLAVEGNSSNVSIVDYAVAPLATSYPRKKLVLTLGFGLGLLLGLGLAFLLQYLDNSIRNPEVLTELLGIPNLGVVPSFEVDSTEPALLGAGSVNEDSGSSTEVPVPVDSGAPYPVMYVTHPKSLASEAYRTIRTGILLSKAGEPPRTMLVTSAQASEGKTTSAINLAASLASAGGRVVVIDADLRRPSLAKQLGIECVTPGLVEVLTGQAQLREAYRADVLKRVTLVLSGTIPPNPAELLGSKEMALVLDRLAADFDYVVIDSPPLLPVTDSMILARYVDGVILVVKGASTPRKVVRDAKSRLDSVGATLLGTVLNNVDVTGGDYYYYNRYYYSYYNRDESASKMAG